MASETSAAPSASGQDSPLDDTRRNDADRRMAIQTPSELPRRSWFFIAKRTAMEISNHRLMTEAAGITFYALLAIFPALASLVSLYGLVSNPQTIADNLDALQGVMPEGGLQIIGDQVHALISAPHQALGFGFVTGLAVSLWSANSAMKSLFDALNIVYDEKEERGFVKRTAVSLGFTAGTVTFMVLALAAVVVLPLVLKPLGASDAVAWGAHLLRWPLMLLAITILLSLIYRFGPSRNRMPWRWVTWGGAIAAITWVVGSALFSWYVQNFGNYNKTYGSLGAVVGFMTWIWLSSLVVLTGAQINAEMEQAVENETGSRDALHQAKS